MDLVEQAKKLNAFDVIKVMMGFIGVIAPGLLILFIFKRDLFISLDLLKLVLLSAALTLPIVGLNFGLVAMLPTTTSPEVHPMATTTAGLLIGAITSVVVFYPPLVAAYFMQLKLYTFIIVLLAIETLIVLSILKELISADRKKILAERQKKG